MDPVGKVNARLVAVAVVKQIASPDFTGPPVADPVNIRFVPLQGVLLVLEELLLPVVPATA
jgi:hypothetical protein